MDTMFGTNMMKTSLNLLRIFLSLTYAGTYWQKTLESSDLRLNGLREKGTLIRITLSYNKTSKRWEEIPFSSPTVRFRSFKNSNTLMGCSKTTVTKCLCDLR